MWTINTDTLGTQIPKKGPLGDPGPLKGTHWGTVNSGHYRSPCAICAPTSYQLPIVSQNKSIILYPTFIAMYITRQYGQKLSILAHN